MKKFLETIIAATLLLSLSIASTASPFSNYLICKELGCLDTSVKFDVPWYVTYSAYLVDNVKGPLIPLTHQNASVTMGLLEKTCKRLAMPVPAVFLNGDESWANMSQGSLTPALSYVIIGKALLNAKGIDDRHIIGAFLHECGHNVESHNVKLALVGALAVGGIATWFAINDHSAHAKFLEAIIATPLIWLGLLWYARFNEYIADRFEVDQCDDPVGYRALLMEQLADLEKRATRVPSVLNTIWYYFVSTHPPLKDRLKAQIERLSKQLDSVT
jgi:Zn-dependent protease with chaperone function